MERRIVSIENYGTIRLKFKDYIDNNGYSRNEVATAIDTRYEVINRLYSGDLQRLDLDILARICFVLNCSVCDLVEYLP